MSYRKVKHHKWSEKELKMEALKYGSRWEFQIKNNAAYKASYRRGKSFFDLICSHMSPIYRNWTNEMLRAEALKYNSRGKFQKCSNSAYQIADSRGLLDSICGHMSYLSYRWKNDELVKEALKYDSSSEFESKNRKAYNSARRKGKQFLDSICSHMSKLKRNWTNKELANEALKYTRIGDFKEKSSSAYALAHRRGIIESIVSHMEPSRGGSSAEYSLRDAIKLIYSDVDKLRDRNVKISNKPYIKGFEIDIFVPELNKGIEFDGSYYHSFKKMRTSKTKKQWSDEDIRNYHQIKDQWFASKGIEILHIKEEDWIKDKEGCIKKCFKFLEIENVN